MIAKTTFAEMDKNKDGNVTKEGVCGSLFGTVGNQQDACTQDIFVEEDGGTK